MTRHDFFLLEMTRCHVIANRFFVPANRLLANRFAVNRFAGTKKIHERNGFPWKSEHENVQVRNAGVRAYVPQGVCKTFLEVSLITCGW